MEYIDIKAKRPLTAREIANIKRSAHDALIVRNSSRVTLPDSVKQITIYNTTDETATIDTIRERLRR